MRYTEALERLKALGCVAIATNGDDLNLKDALQVAYEAARDDEMNDLDEYELDEDTLKVWKLRGDGFRESVPSCTGLLEVEEGV